MNHGDLSSMQLSASKTSSMLEPIQTPVPPQEGGIDVSYSQCSMQPKHKVE